MLDDDDRSEGATSPERMDFNELTSYLERRLKQEIDYRTNWLYILLTRCMKYQNPCFINLTEFENYPSSPPAYNHQFAARLLLHESDKLGTNAEIDRRNRKSKHHALFMDLLNEDRNGDEQLWVSVAMSRPGRHQYIVRYEEELSCGLEDEELDELLVRQFTSLDTLGRQLIDQTTARAGE